METKIMLHQEELEPITIEAAARPVPRPRAAPPARITPISFRLAMARWLHSIKENRPVEFHGAAKAPAWDVILDLYARELTGKRTSISSACITSLMPPTTALRHINILCETAWLLRVADDGDRRRHWLKLSAKARETVETYMERLAEEMVSIIGTRLRGLPIVDSIEVVEVLKDLQRVAMDAEAVVGKLL